jgi:DNA (cytosine-5)-methyltransferase 1
MVWIWSRTNWYNSVELKAIDLYSGVGGWTLGLRMAGVNVVRSCEWWSEANKTHNANFGTTHNEVDIRDLKLSDLPRPGTIGIVVGSPPCTQFSYSNRGGSGDITDGLKDIRKFLEIVEYLKPRCWAMENVPRVADILRKAILPGGPLARFSDLVKVIQVVDAADFGVPQNRRRMIAGDFPVDLFLKYRDNAPRRTLGDVVASLSADPVLDPVYGFRIPKSKLTDHEHEAPLSLEERRLNDESKRFHPVYNQMQFPDRQDRPSRTVTATCTRVSRESIVIRDPKTKVLRRLTVRERAAVQSFPITYQYYGKSYANRQKMVGNAVPPLLTYYIALSMRRVPAEKATQPPKRISKIHLLPGRIPERVKVDKAGAQYPKVRRFRAAIPGLRFGSGVRFEIANNPLDGRVSWRAGFYFGPSKDVRALTITPKLEGSCLAILAASASNRIEPILAKLSNLSRPDLAESLQLAWSHQGAGLSPFILVDAAGDCAARLGEELLPYQAVCREFVLRTLSGGDALAVGHKKLAKNAVQIFAGMLVCARLNKHFTDGIGPSARNEEAVVRRMSVQVGVPPVRSSRQGLAVH